MKICVLVLVGPWPSNQQWLGEMIQSIADQTRQADEVVLIDDGAHLSADVMTEYGGMLRKTNPQSQLIRIATPWLVGPGMLNWAIATSPCNWFFYCDSDDRMLPKCLEYAEGRAKEIGIPCLIRVPVVLSTDITDPVAAGQCLFHKKIWATVGGYSESFPHDEHFFDRLLRRRPNYVFDMIDHRVEMYWHREHPDAMSHNQVAVINRPLDWVRKFGFDPNYVPAKEDFE